MPAYKKSNSGYLPFVQKEQVTSPFTDIQNRAKVDASLKCIMGNERIHVNSLNKLLKESGPNGEPVFEPDNGDSRVRFVGPRWVGFFNNNGAFAYTNNTIGDDKDFVEVTFYGTGLNLLSVIDSSARELSVSVDGGAFGSNVYPSGLGNPLSSRQYKPNNILNLTNGLTLGWHTVKIKVNPSTVLNFYILGFEILNESSQITVKSGKAHGNGYEYLLDADQLIDYNLGFDNVADLDVGTNGGRSIVYLDPSDGTVKKRLTKVDAAPAYLASTDHTNEAPYRKINFREFGRNRGDDFSTLSTISDRAFTIDDGATTLIGNTVVSDGGYKGFRLSESNGYFTLTFVGTGLDVTRSVTTSGGASDADNTQVYVDNVNVGVTPPVTNTPLTASGSFETIKICSGLPYGTHTVKLNLTSEVGPDVRYNDFIVYQPKKPELPEGAVELADYNIMADYVFSSGTTPIDNSQGILYKPCTREIIYAGSGWSILTNSFNDRRSGSNAETTSSGATAEYVFFGTGVGYSFGTFNSHTSNVTMEIDGVLVTDANFGASNIDFKGTGTSSFNGTTGVLNQNSGLPNGMGSLTVKNLSLGFHTVKVTNNVAATITVNGFDIITPIHSPHTTFGSRSLKDCRNFDSAKDVNKAVKDYSSLCVFDDTNTTIIKTNNISQILHTGNGLNLVYFEEVCIDDNFALKGISGGDGYMIRKHTTSVHKGKHLVYAITTRYDGLQTNTTYNSLEITNKLEKDELEE